MKRAIPYILIAALLFILFLQNCGGNDIGNNTGQQEITIPEEKGSFEQQEPVYIQETDTVYITKFKKVGVQTENPVNDSLANAYRKLSDSLNAKESELERYRMFVNAIQIREFENVFEDNKIKATVFGKVQGELKNIALDYTIKSQKVSAKQKQTVFRLLGGLEFGNNTQFNDFRYKANLGFQNQNGNIFRASYEKANNQDYIFVGYDSSIFQIKK